MEQNTASTLEAHLSKQDESSRQMLANLVSFHGTLNDLKTVIQAHSLTLQRHDSKLARLGSPRRSKAVKLDVPRLGSKVQKWIRDEMKPYFETDPAVLQISNFATYSTQISTTGIVDFKCTPSHQLVTKFVCELTLLLMNSTTIQRLTGDTQQVQGLVMDYIRNRYAAMRKVSRIPTEQRAYQKLLIK